MISKNKNKIIWTIVAIVVCVGIFGIWFFSSRQSNLAQNTVDGSVSQNTEAQNNFKTIQIGNAVINAELATTEAQWVQGLSGRTSLATSTGMFFVFNHPAYWGIWMKDMNFPIDVLWITDNLKISDIVENMSPASYPQAYSPHVPALYVLEIPAGTVKTYGLKVGQYVVVK